MVVVDGGWGKWVRVAKIIVTSEKGFVRGGRWDVIRNENIFHE